jgi:tol-pal system protein YbgF
MKKITLLLALCFFSVARAGLFDDDEARRAIIDVRKKIEIQTEEIKKSVDDIKKFQSNLIEQQNLFENLRNEIQRLRGEKEELTQELRKQQSASQALSQGIDERLKNIDERLKKFEPVKVKLDNQEFLADPAEIRSYEAALATFRKGEFAVASEGFIDFIKRYPTSGYSVMSLFWLGNSQYANREYKDAIKNFNNLLAKDSDHARAPDAMLSVANCQLEMKDVKSARKTLDDLMKKYPQSESAAAAKERLSKLK